MAGKGKQSYLMFMEMQNFCPSLGVPIGVVGFGRNCFRTNFDFSCSRLGIKQSNTQIHSHFYKETLSYGLVIGGNLCYKNKLFGIFLSRRKCGDECLHINVAVIQSH